MLRRAYEPLNAHLQPNKVLVIYGPRRVGKTTHLTQFLKSTPLKYKLDSGENFRTPQILGSQDFSQILADIGGCELVAIDAAQSIPNIGMGLKIIVDQEPGIQVVATGSSSFELAAQTGEPLTGRKRTRTLYPMAPSELLAVFNRMELREKLPEFLIFGLYPEVLQAPTRSAKNRSHHGDRQFLPAEGCSVVRPHQKLAHVAGPLQVVGVPSGQPGFLQ